MRGAVDLGLRRLRVRNFLWRIEHSQPHARREQPFQGNIEIGLREQPLLHGIHVRLIIVAVFGHGKEVRALIVHSLLQRNRGGFGLTLREVVPLININDRVAVRYHIAAKLPCAAQLILQQESIRTGRLAIDAVVGAHHRFRFALGNGGAERGQVRVLHIVLRYLYIDRVPRRLRPAVHRKMLRRRDDPEILRIIPLQSRYECHPHASGKKWILSVRFLAAAPARIAEDVDIRRPEVQPLHNVPPSCFHGLVMLGAGFRSDDDRHLVDQRVVKRGRQSDRLWKDRRRSGVCNPMQGFTPPVIGRDLKSRNRPRLVHELRSFLLESHLPYQIIDAHLNGLGRIQIDGAAGGLCIRVNKNED